MVESVDLEPDGRGGEQLIARVRPKAGVASRCSRCGRRCPGYDVSKEPRRWRGLDMGTTPVFLQATTRRVSCPSHGVVVAAVPWARAGSRFTTAFEDTAAWLVSPRHPVGGGGAGAHRVALGVGHRDPRRGRPRRGDRPAGGAAPDRDRRDLLQEGPAVPAGRDLPRHRTVGVGRQGPHPRRPWAGSSTTSAPSAPPR